MVSLTEDGTNPSTEQKKSKIPKSNTKESGSLRHAMVGGPVAAAEITATPQWAVKTGPGATSGTLGLDQNYMGKSCSGARWCSELGWAQERKEDFFLGIQTGRLGPKV